MKNYLKISMLVLAMMVSVSLFAQKNYKFGHINSQELISSMPEYDSAQVELQNFAKGIQDQMEVMQVEYNRKLEDYKAEMNNLTDLIRQTKEEELMNIQQRMQTFNQNAQQNMTAKQNEVMQPIIEKAQKAIKDVGAENSFTYIYDLAGGIILYFSADSEDVLPLVRKKLGLN
jgi:outer membrane protein